MLERPESSAELERACQEASKTAGQEPGNRSAAVTVDDDVTGLKSVARRISTWTTNLLASAIVLLIALLLGNHLIRLYRPRSAPAQNVVDNASAFDQGLTPLKLEFGHGDLILNRQPFFGDQKQAIAKLIAACNNQLREAAMPSRPIDPSESALLARIEARRPRELGGNGAAVFQLDEAFPMVVGTKSRDAAEAADKVGESQRRVVIWGVAVPALDYGGWTLYTFQPKADEGSTASSGATVSAVPMPPGTKHLMTIGWPGGGSLAAFRGTDRPQDWMKFYDDWFAARSASSLIAWHQFGAHWHGRFELRQDGAASVIDIQFAQDSGSNGPEGFGNLNAEPVWRGVISESKIRERELRDEK